MTRTLRHEEFGSVEQRRFKDFQPGDEIVRHGRFGSNVNKVLNVETTFVWVDGAKRERTIITVEAGPQGRSWEVKFTHAPRYLADAIKRG